jgi:pSer/pThr/pTyr-binding forkhead associated (FHA) protein
MAGAKIPITFRIYKGDTFVREETLTQPVIKVGKLSSSHLRLDDDTVSRMHAVIEVSGPGDISIIDLGSTKGTHVNGQKVNKAKLQSGDQIVVGNTRLEIAMGASGDEEEEAPTRVHDVGNIAARGGDARPPAPRPAAPAPAASPAAPPRPAAPSAAPPAAPPRPAAPPPPAAAPVTPRPATPAAPATGMMVAATPFGGAPPAVMGPAAAQQAPVNFGADKLEDIGGARAIEVAAMLGDSVIGVKHLMDPKTGKVTPTTYALFAGGAVMLLMALTAFFIGVQNAEFNKHAHHAWVNVEKLPEFEFRPRLLSPVYDVMAFGGILTGFLAMTYGLIRLRNERQSPYFRIGTAPEVEFALQASPSESFPLVGPLGDDFVFHFGAGMEGEMNVDGESIKLAELQARGRAQPSGMVPGAMQVPIPPKARIRVNAGKNTFLISAVPRPRRQAAPLFASLESRAMAFFGASAVFHLGLVALLLNLPPDPRSLSLELRGSEGRLTRFQSKAQEDPKQEEEEETENTAASGGTGTAMALDEGKMGKQDSTRAAGQYAMKNEGGDPQLAREQAIEQARDAGFLGAIKMTQGGAFASLTGTGDFSSGLDDANVYGGLLGDEVGEMQGGFGFGRSGFGAGGGGTGWGTIGTGNYGTIGHGSGTGSGYGVGSGRGGMRGRRSSPPDVQIGNAVATGDLDKNIIRRYIRQKLPRITYCYEKQLLVRADLSGTVVTQFQISPQGAVLNSKAEGVSKEVADCVAEVIQGITFPKPKGGGLVQVRYPFTFRPTGG